MPLKAPAGYKRSPPSTTLSGGGGGRKSESEVYTRARGVPLERSNTTKTVTKKEKDESKSPLRAKLSIRSVTGLSLRHHQEKDKVPPSPPIPKVIVTPHSRSASLATVAVDEKRGSLLSPSFTPHSNGHSNGHANGRSSGGGNGNGEYFGGHALEPVMESTSLTSTSNTSANVRKVESSIHGVSELGERKPQSRLPVSASESTSTTVPSNGSNESSGRPSLLARGRTLSLFSRPRSKSVKEKPSVATHVPVPVPSSPPATMSASASKNSGPIAVKASSDGHGHGHAHRHHHTHAHPEPSSALPAVNGDVHAMGDSLPSPSSSIESTVSSISVLSSSSSVVSPPIIQASKGDPMASGAGHAGGGEGFSRGLGKKKSRIGLGGFWKRVF